MKTKTFAMLTMTGLLAASIAYVTPALADDSSNSGSATQAAPADGSQNNAAPNIGADNMGGTPNQTDSNSSSSSSSSDDSSGSPDQATGDEDY